MDTVCTGRVNECWLNTGWQGEGRQAWWVGGRLDRSRPSNFATLNGLVTRGASQTLTICPIQQALDGAVAKGAHRVFRSRVRALTGFAFLRSGNLLSEQRNNFCGVVGVRGGCCVFFAIVPHTTRKFSSSHQLKNFSIVQSVSD